MTQFEHTIRKIINEKPKRTLIPSLVGQSFGVMASCFLEPSVGPRIFSAVILVGDLLDGDQQV